MFVSFNVIFNVFISFIRNEKQNDFIDQIESVAYVLCRENPVNFTNFQQIFYTKGVSCAILIIECKE